MSKNTPSFKRSAGRHLILGLLKPGFIKSCDATTCPLRTGLCADRRRPSTSRQPALCLYFRLKAKGGMLCLAQDFPSSRCWYNWRMKQVAINQRASALGVQLGGDDSNAPRSGDLSWNPQASSCAIKACDDPSVGQRFTANAVACQFIGPSVGQFVGQFGLCVCLSLCLSVRPCLRRPVRPSVRRSVRADSGRRDGGRRTER